MLFDGFVLVGFGNMCVVFVMTQADLILAFGAIFGIWYLVFVRFSPWFNFATRQLLVPRFVSRPGHVTGW